MTSDELIEELRRLPAGTEVVLKDHSAYLSAFEGVETVEVGGDTVAVLTMTGDSPYELTGETNDDGEAIAQAVG